jgi:hypothetical protein
MPRVSLDFRTLLLLEDEEAGDTHMAMYASITDSNGNAVASFRWNNSGTKVNETNTYSLGIDPDNPNVVDFDLNTWATISVRGYTDDDENWPSSGTHENDLGSAQVVIDPANSSTLGSLNLGPTTTDNGNAGFSVDIVASVVSAPSTASVRIQLESLTLYEDEEAGDTHMAIYVYRDASTEIFRWNNGGNKVNEVATYGLSNGSPSATLRLDTVGPTVIWVEGYADDDQGWPSLGSNENSLGRALITIDPSDPSTLWQRQLGPTRTDNDNQGYEINLSIEALPADATTPDLAITGVEVTQAIQYFRSTAGADNSLPLVAQKDTLVRAYLDSGLDQSSPSGGLVPNVTGTLTVMGSSNLSLAQLAPMTAQPIANVDPSIFTDTLNFLIPRDQATGTLDLTVQASGGGSTSNPFQLTVQFQPTLVRSILIVRVQHGDSGTPPDEMTYFGVVNQLPQMYPIATNPAVSIRYQPAPGGEVYVNNHDLSTDDGWDDLMDDLEDIQEDFGDDDYKVFALLSSWPNAKWNGEGSDWDNIAAAFAGGQWHELGHVYGLDHAPSDRCNPDPKPDDVDDDYVPPDGSLGGVGVDPANNMAFAASSFDFMGYCGRGWVSAYHWVKLFNRFKTRYG